MREVKTVATAVARYAVGKIHGHMRGCWKCCFLMGAVVTWKSLLCANLLSHIHMIYVLFCI